MNTLKYIAFSLMILSFNAVKAQDNEDNYLTSEEFGNIKINGIRFDDIEKTEGDKTKVKALLGKDIIIEKGYGESYGNSITIKPKKQKGFYIVFADYDETSNKYWIDDFEILNSNSNITIKGKTVTIGDHIKKLGKVNIRYSSYSDAYLIIFQVKMASSSLGIEFDPKTKKITKIEYITYT